MKGSSIPQAGKFPTSSLRHCFNSKRRLTRFKGWIALLPIFFLLVHPVVGQCVQPAVAAGADHSLALKEDGTVWAWGQNNYGQLGDNTTTGRYTPVKILGPEGTAYLTGVKAIAAGYFHSVALKEDGTVWAWGRNTQVLDYDSGQLGDNTSINRYTPVQVLGPGGVGVLSGVKEIAAGNYHSVALKEDGTVWAWGSNVCHQLGDNTMTDRPTPIQVLGPGGVGVLSGVKKIAAGFYYTMALKEDGTVWAWGSNYYGQLGDGTTLTEYYTPIQVLGPGGVGVLSEVMAVAAARYHTVALKENGTVWACGTNDYGQLGDGSNTPRYTPVQVLGSDGVGVLTGVKAIAAGGFYYTLALKEDGTVWAWGYNYSGQLGDNTKTERHIPVQVFGPGGVGYLTGVKAIAAGYCHIVALKEDGTVWAWGHNNYGQIGDKTILDRYTPAQVKGPGAIDYLYLSGLDHFTFSDISSPQAIGVPFPVTITARDYSGNIYSSYSGRAALSSTMGDIKPTEVQFSGGSATVNVTLRGYYNLEDCRLVCSAQGRSDKSSSFDVTGGFLCLGTLNGRVKDSYRVPIAGAAVTLHDSRGVEAGSALTDAYGMYAFWGLRADRYTITASKNGRSAMDFADVRNNETNFTPDLRLNLLDLCEGTPVILISGIMGSTSKPGELYPFLSREDTTEDLYLYNKFGIKWDDLRKRLEEEGFFVIDFPWNWLWECDDVVARDLVPKLSEVISDYSITGKVHIVAHSMGGLVSRAYIQKKIGYGNDIDKLILVGTPHLGSANPYYIWEGGEPLTLDSLVDKHKWVWTDIVGPFEHAYSNVISMIMSGYETLTSGAPPLTGSTTEEEDPVFTNTEIRKFVREKAPSLRQLMQTQYFLMDDEETWNVTTAGNENTWLKSLNAGAGLYVPPGDRMCPADMADPGDKVRVAVFAGDTAASTIGAIQCRTKGTVDDFYEDGIPRWPRDEPDNVFWITGDGTVPYESAVLPSSEGWGKTLGIASNVPHKNLVAHFTEEIVAYLKGNTGTLTAYNTLHETLDEPEEAPASLTITLKGDVRIQVTDTLANRTGIDPSTGDVLEEIPGGTCTFMGTSGGVTVEGPPAGTYTVTYFGEVPKDFSLTFYYQDGDMNQQASLRGFCPSESRNLTVTVDGITGMTVTPEVGSPTGLTAEPYVSGEALLTRLTWTPPSGETVSGYRLYGAEADEPYYSFLTDISSTVTTWDTTHPWSSDGTVMARYYAVSALNGSGHESFFSNITRNDDRDHDGIPDGEEGTYGTGMENPDTDGDGVLDGAEVNAGTSPVSPDTDGDGYWDGIETEGKSDPLDDLSIPSIHVNPDGLCCGKVICCTSIAEGIATSQTWGRLKVIEGTADEAVLLADPKYIYLQGGWDTEFTANASRTAIRSLTISKGTVIVEGLSIGQ